jgi:MFS-type transporter involved in bile tolerance (Atg22 family)
LFAVTGRTSSFIGPTVYGFLAYEAAIYFQNQGYLVLAAERLGQRVAIGSIVVFLLAGLLILLGVNDPTKKYMKL